MVSASVSLDAVRRFERASACEVLHKAKIPLTPSLRSKRLTPSASEKLAQISLNFAMYRSFVVVALMAVFGSMIIIDVKSRLTLEGNAAGVAAGSGMLHLTHSTRCALSSAIVLSMGSFSSKSACGEVKVKNGYGVKLRLTVCFG